MNGEKDVNNNGMIDHQREYIFGIQAVSEALAGSLEIEKIIVRKDQPGESTRPLLAEANRLRIPVHRVPLPKLNAITRKNHQGIIAFISPVKYASLDHIITETYSNGIDPLFLMLDRITDVRNFGAMARTAEGLGFHGIIIPSRGGASINQEAMKTSAGALAHIPVCRVISLPATVQYLMNNGIRLAACTEKTDSLLFDLSLTGPLTLVMGSEQDGISSEVLRLCDTKLKIPMFGKIDSYNVSVSMAIAGIEIRRQRMG